MTMTETVLEPCEKTFRVTECEPSAEPQMGTCYAEEEVLQPETCFKIQYKTECHNVQTTRLKSENFADKVAGYNRG